MAVLDPLATPLAGPVSTIELGGRLVAASPRRTPPPTPLVSIVIHGAVLVLWIMLLAAPFGFKGIWVWSSGLLYAGYDTVLLIFTFWQTLSILRPREAKAAPPSAGGARVSVSVIVAARNEASVLPITLDALLAQTDPPDEILIADDGSTDATPDVLKARFGLTAPQMGAATAGPSTIRWMRVEAGGKARAMNAAMSLVRSEVVLTVDADTLLEPGALAAVREAFKHDPGLVAATGILTPVCAPTRTGRIMEWFQTYEYVRNFLSRYAWMRLDSLVLISGAFASFRRAAVLEVGGFDPDCLVEDYELIHRLKRYGTHNGLGWTTQVLGGALARTEAPSTPGAFLRQRRRWFGGFLQTQYWYRDMVGDARYGALGVWHLPVKAIDTLQPLYGLTAFALLCFYALTGRLGIFLAISGVILAKIAIDLAFHLWSVRLYRRWLGSPTEGSLGMALLAALIEPFSFQLLRHTAAMWGWATFLTGRQTWGSQTRAGALA